MSSKCPPAPVTANSSLALTMSVLKSGTRLARYHGPDWPGHSFNPNIGKRIDYPEEGARFNPFPGAPAKNIPTIYAADGAHPAALESVFHNVPHIASPTYPQSQLADWRYSDLEVLRDLTVFELTNPHLRQLPVPGRTASLEEGELIHTPTAEYPNTRTWARFLYDSVPKLDGLAWRPRLGGEGWSYVLFGDRCGAASLKTVSGPETIDSGSKFIEIEKIAIAASIHIIRPK